MRGERGDHFQSYSALNKSCITEIWMESEYFRAQFSKMSLQVLNFFIGTAHMMKICYMMLHYCWFWKILTVIFPFIWIHHQSALCLFQLFLQKFMLCLYFSYSPLAPFKYLQLGMEIHQTLLRHRKTISLFCLLWADLQRFDTESSHFLVC